MLNSLAPRQDVRPTPGDIIDSAPFQEPRVVHSGFGRLRVHLPHWSSTPGADIAAGLRRLAGVTHAEANPLTGNVLILFQPRQTSAQALLQALPALRLALSSHAPLFPTACARLPALAEDPGQFMAAAGQPLEPNQGRSVIYVTGTTRVVYKALGWSSVGMAVVGAITPGIPTAPFVILAGYFFTRSSPRAHEWLRQSRWFGPMLRDWEEHRGIRRWVRNTTLALIAGSMVVTALLGLSAPLTATIISMQVIGIGIVLHLRVIEPASVAPAAASV
jgi:uncharacterized membrane protein YbaN (DUF454 family)